MIAPECSVLLICIGAHHNLLRMAVRSSADQNFTSWLDARTLHVSQSQPCVVSLNGPSFSSRKSVRVSWHQSQRTTCGFPNAGLSLRKPAATSFSFAIRSSLRSTFPAVIRTACLFMKSSVVVEPTKRIESRDSDLVQKD